MLHLRLSLELNLARKDCKFLIVYCIENGSQEKISVRSGLSISVCLYVSVHGYRKHTGSVGFIT